MNPDDRRPLYVQIADGISEQIESGQFASGDRLPTMRALSATLRVALITVAQAYELLVTQGRVVSRVGRGTFVAAKRAAPEAYLRGWEPDVGRFLQAERMEGVLDELSRAHRAGVISLATGHPATETFPMVEFGKAMNRTLLDDSPEIMQYRANSGDPDLCEALASALRRRGAPIDAADIIVSSGAQQAADIVASTLLGTRETVAVESPSYPGTLGVFDARGATYVEITSDESGVRIEDMERVFAEYRPRLFYLNSVSQNPTGRMLPERRGKQIVALARRYDVVILEDQTGWVFTYDGPAPPPLAAHDTDGRVIVMESLSKSIFPALRIGYLAAKGALRPPLQAAKLRADSFTSTLMQRALWRFMTAPAYARHLKNARTLYRNRRDTFIQAFSEFAPWLAPAPPAAGTNVWLALPARISTRAAFDACAREGVLVMPAEPFYPTRRGPAALRLSFGDLSEADAREGVARLARALAPLANRREEGTAASHP